MSDRGRQDARHAGKEDAPELSQVDWNDLDAGELTPTDTPANGDLRYRNEVPGELAEEDDDNEYQESDEALPDDAGERAIARDPDKEGGRFDEV